MPDGQRLSNRESAARMAKLANERTALLRDCRRLLYDFDLVVVGSMTQTQWRLRRGQLVERIDEAMK